MRYFRFLLFSATALALSFATNPAAAQQAGGNQDSAAQVFRKLERVTSELGEHEYLLRYRFQPEQTLAYEVEHLVQVKTTIDGVTQSQQSRSTSEKNWKVTQVSGDGNATFSHLIKWVNMWSESQGRAPVIYDSRKDKEPPVDYAGVADTLGKVLASVTVNNRGEIVGRDDTVKQIDMGTGGLLMPLPESPVRIGQEWAVPKDVPVRLADGSFKAVKTRLRYRLVKVETGIATVDLKTEILTPDISPRVRSQLIQKLSSGNIKFDIDAGRIISKKLEWDETVVGFNGPKSNMSYLGKITESYMPSPRVARANN